MSQRIAISLDLDGVLVDCIGGLKSKLGFTFPVDISPENKIAVDSMWDDLHLNHIGFWNELNSLSGYRCIYEKCIDIDPLTRIVSATPEPFTGDADARCAIEKKCWVYNHFGIKQASRTIITKSKLKQNFMLPNCINVLVDDHISNINRWRAAGGIGIHHTSVEQTIKELELLNDHR